MTDDIKELQELAKYYQNEANYYHEKATQWHKQSDEDEAERERLVDIMCKIYELTGAGDAAREEIERLTGEALSAVAGIGLPKIRFEMLRRYADSLVGRTR